MTKPDYPTLAPDALLRKLELPGRPVRMVLDTDTFNEIDDQFAVIYALLSPERVQLEACYAAPFYNTMSDGPQDGMEKSYRELLRIREVMGRDDLPVYSGSTMYLPAADQPVESDAARDLVRRAMACEPSDPLYVVGIAALTNIASAILLEPRIVERIVVVWLGGHAFHWPDTREFNLEQDVHAARILFDSGVPVVLAPCMGVASHLQTTLSELADYARDTGEAGRYLYETYRDCASDHYGYSRIIWDLAAIAWLVEPQWCPSELVQSPRISDSLQWLAGDDSRHPIRYIRYLHRDAVFQDLFRKLAL